MRVRFSFSAIPLTPPVCNQRGQGLIEYLIIVALMGVAAIGIMRSMQETVTKQFGSVTSALQGRKQDFNPTPVEASLVRKKDMGDFLTGVANSSKGGANGQSAD